MADSSANLTTRGATALGWGLGVSMAKLLATIGVQAALARILSPADFGLFAMGMLVIGVASYFADVGLATSLVQKDDLLPEDVQFVFTWNIIISVLVGLTILLGSSWLSGLFGKPELTGVFMALAPVFVINAAASVSISLLRRRLEYKSIQLAGLVGYLVGFGVVGIGLALIYGSVYALVGAFVTQSILTLIGVYAQTRHSLLPSISAASGLAHMGFGGTVFITNLVNWAVTAMDRLIIGRQLSMAQLGLYAMAYNLVNAPVGALYSTLQSVVFSTTARIQGDSARLGNAYQELLQAVTVIAFPPFAAVALMAAPLVNWIYGAKWAGAAVFASIFALTAPMLLVWGISTPFLWNNQRRSDEFKVQVPFLFVAAGALYFAVQVSLTAAACASGILFALRTLIIVVLVARSLSIGLAALLVRLRPALVVSVTVGVAVWACTSAVLVLGAAYWVVVLTNLVLMAASMLVCFVLSPTLLPMLIRRQIGLVAAPKLRIARFILRRLSAS